MALLLPRTLLLLLLLLLLQIRTTQVPGFPFSFCLWLRLTSVAIANFSPLLSLSLGPFSLFLSLSTYCAHTNLYMCLSSGLYTGWLLRMYVHTCISECERESQRWIVHTVCASSHSLTNSGRRPLLGARVDIMDFLLPHVQSSLQSSLHCSPCYLNHSTNLSLIYSLFLIVLFSPSLFFFFAGSMVGKVCKVLAE